MRSKSVIISVHLLDYALRTARTLHGSLVTRHISTEPFLLFAIHTPLLLERVKSHVHDTIENLALSLLLHTLDQLIQDP
jgi:hypothetical protein